MFGRFGNDGDLKNKLRRGASDGGMRSGFVSFLFVFFLPPLSESCRSSRCSSLWSSSLILVECRRQLLDTYPCRRIMIIKCKKVALNSWNLGRQGKRVAQIGRIVCAIFLRAPVGHSSSKNNEQTKYPKIAKSSHADHKIVPRSLPDNITCTHVHNLTRADRTHWALPVQTVLRRCAVDNPGFFIDVVMLQHCRNDIAPTAQPHRGQSRPLSTPHLPLHREGS